jgi:hypothetical protein
LVSMPMMSPPEEAIAADRGSRRPAKWFPIRHSLAPWTTHDRDTGHPQM